VFKILERLILSATLLMLLASCGEVDFSDLSSGWDPSNTQIIASNSALADGQDRAWVRLRVFDRTGKPLPDLELSAASMNNINFVSCDRSNSEGYTTCYFRSTVAGTRSTDVFDTFGRLAVDLTFMPPTQMRMSSQTLPSSRLSRVSAGYTVTTEVKKAQGFESTSGGYLIKTRSVYE
jgi:hypothetical protein